MRAPVSNKQAQHDPLIKKIIMSKFLLSCLPASVVGALSGCASEEPQTTTTTTTTEETTAH